jgi:hypothetical protein
MAKTAEQGIAFESNYHHAKLENTERQYTTN